MFEASYIHNSPHTLKDVSYLPNLQQKSDSTDLFDLEHFFSHIQQKVNSIQISVCPKDPCNPHDLPTFDFKLNKTLLKWLHTNREKGFISDRVMLV